MARKREERLLSLVAYLTHSGRPRTLDEVRAAFPEYKPGDPGRQMFFQDKRTLAEAGLEVREKDDRYWIPPEDVYLDDFFLEDAERAALLVALQSLRGGSTLLPSVGTALGGFGDLVDVTSTTGPRVEADLEAADAVKVLHRATTERRQVRARYKGTDRVLEPYGLVLRRGNWYLYARDIGDGVAKNFRVERFVEEPVAVGPARAFEPPGELDLRTALQDGWQLPSDERHAVVVVVDQHLAGRAAFEVAATADLEWQPDGSLRIAMTVTHLPAFRSWLLTYRDHAVVEAPEPVREHLRRWFRALAGDG